jgi:CheY-like chemotaxis protein
MTDRLKVLVVEDSKQIQVIYRIGLNDKVFDKCFAENGYEALELYEKWAPDMILLDVMIPGMSGYAVIETIRSEKGDTATAIIMASSISNPGAVTEFLKLGIQGYLVKPFTHKDVGVKVLQYYQKSNPERATAAMARFEAERRSSLRS